MYESVKQSIIDALVGRKGGTKIQPENHQAYELEFLEYVRKIELSTFSVLEGFAYPNTVPIQPDNAKVGYIGGVSNNTIIYENFYGQDGNPITVSAGTDESFFIVLIWNTAYWSYEKIPANINNYYNGGNTTGLLSYLVAQLITLDQQKIARDNIKALSKLEKITEVIRASELPVANGNNRYIYDTTDKILYHENESDWSAINDDNIILFENETISYLYQKGVTSLVELWDNKPIISTFKTDTPVYGTSMGKYASGSTIPSAGKTFEEVFKDCSFAGTAPTGTLSVSNTIPYHPSAPFTNTLNFTKSATTPGATIASVSLQYRRGSSGTWVVLSTDTSILTFSHTITDLSSDYTSAFNYQYIITDSNGMTVTKTASVTPASYSAPTSTLSTSTGTTKELGNISSTFSGSVNQTTQNGVAITDITIQYSTNNSTWNDIESVDSPFSGYVHNDSILLNATVIYYRLKILVNDNGTLKTTYSSTVTINYVYKSAFGYLSSTNPALSDLLAMTSTSLTNAKAKTITATAGSGLYTYYAYCAAAGDLSGVVMDGVAAVLGAFTKLADITGTNSYGANVTYRIYKSNAPAAFTNNQLIIS